MPRLALGTVQFGLPYGPEDSPRRLERGEVREILAAAWDSGIDMLDTAAAYGDAEKVIGELRPAGARFAVVSKTPRLGLASIGPAEARSIQEGVRCSLGLLGVEALDALLVHHAPDLLAAGGVELFHALEELRADGIVHRIGISIYDAATLKSVLGRFPVEIVQLPINVLDQRFLADGTLADLAKRRIEVHARSVFLQGVLLIEPGRLPARFAGIRGQIGRFQSDAARAGLSPSAAALGFIAGCPGIARVVIGVNSATQLRTDVAEFSGAGAVRGKLDFSAYAVQDSAMVDPRSWS
jgi:aryl-alcohol dehydrogenase-like predicted oxidoreductase